MRWTDDSRMEGNGSSAVVQLEEGSVGLSKQVDE